MWTVLIGLTLMTLLAGSTDAHIEEPFFLLARTPPSNNNGGSITRMSANDYYDNFQICLVGSLYKPMAVDFDHVKNEVYWSEVGLYRGIRKAPLRGGRPKAVINGISLTGSLILGLAVDSSARLLFYSDAFVDVIGKVRLEDSYPHEIIISTKLNSPRAVTLDTSGRRVYWTDAAVSGKIETANYDGSDRKALIDSGLYLVNALALDIPNNRMYWVDAGYSVVELSDLKGNGRQTLLRAAAHHYFFGMALHEGLLFITDWGATGSSTNTSQLIRLTTAGEAHVVASLGSGRMNDIHAYPVPKPSHGYSPLAQSTSWTGAAAVVASVVIAMVIG